MCDALRRDFALSASFELECFDCSEATTREGNELVVQKENCVVEEIKEVELRSRSGKFIYNGTYNSVGCCRASAGSTHILERFEIFMVPWFDQDNSD